MINLFHASESVQNNLAGNSGLVIKRRLKRLENNLLIRHLYDRNIKNLRSYFLYRVEIKLRIAFDKVTKEIDLKT